MTTLTVGDTGPALTGTLNANLTGATVVVHIKRPDRTVVIKTATVTDALTGAWSIAWSAGDLSQAGAYTVEVQVTFSNFTIQTFGTDKRGGAVLFFVRGEIA